MIDFDKSIGLLNSKLSAWIDAMVLKTPNVVLALFVFSISLFIAKTFSKLIHKVLDNTYINPGIAFLLERFLYTVIVFMGLFASLNLIGLDKTVTSLLAGAGIIGLAVSFAFQNVASNFISGVIIAVRKPYFIDDIIESHNVLGKVVEISLNHTVVLNKTGQYITLPNKEIIERPLYNYTRGGKREIELKVIVALDADLEFVKKILQESISTLTGLVSDEKADVYFLNYEAYGIAVEVNFWIPFKDIIDFESYKSNAVMAIQKALKANNISIPLPEQKVLLVK